MAEKVIGAKMASTITQQIQDRGSIQARAGKGKGSHLFGNANSAWALLRSGVDTLSTSQAAQAAKAASSSVNGASNLARAAELTGGLLNDGQQRSGINRSTGSPSVKFNPGSNRHTVSNASYTTSDFRGTRPQSGITSISIASANTYGTLLNAQVTFTAHSLEELEVLELLYMRPGMYVLLEFGHSFYPINARSGQGTGTDFQPYGYATRDDHTVSNSTFYDGKNPEKIEEEIARLRVSTKHNYEGVFGPVTNFSWELTPDGSYQCSIDITSKGIILEGLKLAPATANIPAAEAQGTKTPDGEEIESADDSNSTNIFTLLVKALATYNGDDSFPNASEVISLAGQQTLSNPFGNYFFPNFLYKAVDGGIFTSYKSDRFGYLSIGCILTVINEFSTIHGPVGENPIICFNTEYGQRFRSYPDHFSANPLIALMPKTSAKYPDFQVTRGDGLGDNIKSAADGDGTDILDIYVSLHAIARAAKAVTAEELKKPSSGIGVVDFLRILLDDITAAFGGINAFDIMSQNQSPTPGKFYVVDRAHVPGNGYPKLRLTGDESIATNLTIKSQIPSSIQNTIAIQAAAGADSTTSGDDGMKNYLNHTVNRYYNYISYSKSKEDGEKKSGPAQDSKAQSEARSITETQLKEFYDNLNAELGEQTALKPDTIDGLQGDAKVVITADNRAYYSDGKTDTFPIPLELSLEMLGIGGIAPGSAFNIDRELLPSMYQVNTINFIVTTINHSISTDNVWKTVINAQMFKADS